MKVTRPYEMRARAEAKAQTSERILLAVIALAEETFDLQPTLDNVAGRAGVSVQTVLRHFGSRDALLDAALAKASAAVTQERAAPIGDVAAALDAIVGHYEVRGDFVLRLLGREHDDPRVAQIVRSGRALHRAWVEEVFAPWLPAQAAPRAELVDLLVVATDLYTWKLLRRDRGLDRATTEDRMRRLVRAVLPPEATP